MRLAVGLLLLVGIVHFGYDPIAMLYEQQEAAARAWFYILRGIEGVALFGAVGALSNTQAVKAVAALGMFEEAMTSACRVSKPIGEVPGYEPFCGLCGPQWYRAGAVLLGLVAAAIAYEIVRRHRGGQKRP